MVVEESRSALFSQDSAGKKRKFQEFDFTASQTKRHKKKGMTPH